MSKIAKLDIFTLRIREKGNREKFLNLDDIAGFNLFDELSAYLKKNVYLFKIDDKMERTYRIERNEYENGSIFCRIKVGKFGETSDIVDTISGSGVFHKEQVHADTIPLFLHIKACESKNKAYVHIQSNNNRTLIPELRTILESVLSNIREELFLFELKPLKKSITLSNFLSEGMGCITSLSIKIKDTHNYKELEPMDLSIKSRARNSFPNNIVKEIIKSSESGELNSLLKLFPKQLKGMNVHSGFIGIKRSNGSKIKIKIGSTINLSSSNPIIVTSKNIDKSGHPSYQFLKEFSSSLL